MRLLGLADDEFAVRRTSRSSALVAFRLRAHAVQCVDALSADAGDAAKTCETLLGALLEWLPAQLGSCVRVSFARRPRHPNSVSQRGEVQVSANLGKLPRWRAA